MREGLDFLLTKDSFFKKSKIDIQNFVWPYMGPGLPGLVRIVIGQQVSTAAAATMWARFQEKVPQVTPQAILKLTPDDMETLLEGKRFAPHRTAASLLLWHTKAGAKN